VGFESLDTENLSMINKQGDLKISPIEPVRTFRDYGIGILVSFILGYDHDTPDTFKKTLDFCNQAKIGGALFPILTPYPGTFLRERLMREGRILTDGWDFCDMEYVAFAPEGMSPGRLQEDFEWLNSSFLSGGVVFQKTLQDSPIHSDFRPYEPRFPQGVEEKNFGKLTN
jgi:radical SAM superfamily enzyme YgiQ (UPF0313 family)